MFREFVSVIATAAQPREVAPGGLGRAHADQRDEHVTEVARWMICPRCRCAMKLVEIAHEREAIARVLATVGLRPRPPPLPRPPLAGQLEPKFAA
jgi:hypothetical protein